MISLFLTLAISLGAFAEQPWPSFALKNRKQLREIWNIAEMAEGEKRAWYHWQTGLNAALLNDNKLAVKALSALSEMKQTVVGADQIHLNLGRVYFQMREFDKAVEHYQLVPKTSEFWFEATEEEAWAYVRQGKPDLAVSKTTTLLSPVFERWVGPESYYLAAYNYLKVCDYVNVFKTNRTFKERFTKRIKELETLAGRGENAKAVEAIQKMRSKAPAFTDADQNLPRLFWRDTFVLQHAEKLRRAHSDLAGGTKGAESDLKKRLKVLAHRDLAEFKTVINKLTLIEAEVIQRIYLDESLKGERTKVAEVNAEDDQLVFPASDELWLDEIDSFQSNVKSCPELKEAKL